MHDVRNFTLYFIRECKYHTLYVGCDINICNFLNESFIYTFEGLAEFYMMHVSKFCINIFEDVEKYFSWTDNSSKLDIKCTKLLNGNYMENINGNTSYFTFQDQKHTGHVLILCSSNSSFFSQVQRQKDLDFSFPIQMQTDLLF